MISILFGVVDAEHFSKATDKDPIRLMSSASVLEASLVSESELGDQGSRELDLLLLKAGVEVVAFNEGKRLIGNAIAGGHGTP